jgi:hypothetical protein
MRLPRTALFALSVALAFHVLGDDASTGPKDLGTVTIGNKTYANLHVTSVTDLGIKATWDGGLGMILFSEMTPDLQKKLGYEPDKFKAAANAQAEHDAQSDAVAAAQAKVDQANLQKGDTDAAKQRAAAVEAPKKSTPNLVAKVTQVLPNGVLADKMEAHFSAPVADSMASVGGGGRVAGGGFYYEESGTTIFIEMPSSGLAEGQQLNLNVERNGTYTFTDTKGASRTVEKWTQYNQ